MNTSSVLLDHEFFIIASLTCLYLHPSTDMSRFALRTVSRSRFFSTPAVTILNSVPTRNIHLKPTNLGSTVFSAQTSAPLSDAFSKSQFTKAANLSRLPEMEVPEQSTQEHSDAYYFSIIVGLLGASVATVLWAYRIPSGENVFEAPEKVLLHILNVITEGKRDAELLTVSEALSKVPEAALCSIVDNFTRITAFTPFLIVNITVFLMSQMDRFEDLMRRHCMLSYTNIRNGRLHTLLTHSFTHFSLGHIAMNMIAIASFSAILTRIWSPEKYAGVYLGTAVASGTLSVLGSVGLFNLTALMRNPRPLLLLPSVGASGVATALVAYVCLRFPHSQIGLILLPFSADAGNILPFAILFELLGLAWVLSGRHSPISHMGHLSGYICGSLLYAYDKQNAKNQVRRRFTS